MLFKAGRLFAAALVVSLLIQMQISVNGYAARGAMIAFTSTRDGNEEIYVMDGDGNNQVRLTDNPAEDYDPAWSPDGRKIAFVSNRDNGVDRIYVMDSHGQNLMLLTKTSSGTGPSWSPDGRKIVFSRNKGGKHICVMDADGGNQTLLTHVGFNILPAWSPDGRRIAFVSHGNAIVVMDVDGTNRERLIGEDLPWGFPSWSPNGLRIAYESRRDPFFFQISVVKTNGSGGVKRLTRHPPNKTRPAWSPDGDTIAYVQSGPKNKTRIHLMTARGKHIKQLGEDHEGSDTGPDWFDPRAWTVSPAANYVTTWGKIKEPTSARR